MVGGGDVSATTAETVSIVVAQERSDPQELPTRENGDVKLLNAIIELKPGGDRGSELSRRTQAATKR